MKRHCTSAIIAIAATVGPLATSATAESVEQFYKGKTVSAIVPFGPGGGYAIYTQIMARHLPKHIPGQPTIVPQYMPGAGGIVASNHVYNIAKRDGSVMAMVSDSVALASVIDAGKIKYKVNEFIWIGAIERVNNVLAVRSDAGVKTLDDLKSTEMVLGASGPGSPTSLLPRLLAWLGPYKVKTVEGYRGINPMFTALERKEISGMTVSWTVFKTLKADWFKSGFLLPILQFGEKKEKDLANVPLAIDLAKTDEQKAVARFMASNVDVGRSFILPPQVPADRVAALRAAFDKMIDDTDFKAEIAKAGFELSPATGQEVQAAVAEATRLDDAQAEKIRATFASAAKPAKK
jgi:tripartite-type tricarboxylate transporter receptor subunit TctC